MFDSSFVSTHNRLRAVTSRDTEASVSSAKHVTCDPPTRLTHNKAVWDLFYLDLLQTIPAFLPRPKSLGLFSFSPSFGVIALNLLLSVIYTDTSSHFRLFVDGRLAGSSCLVGCAGVRPQRTSWQPCLRQPCAFLLALSLFLSLFGNDLRRTKTPFYSELGPSPQSHMQNITKQHKSIIWSSTGVVSGENAPRASIWGKDQLVT